MGGIVVVGGRMVAMGGCYGWLLWVVGGQVDGRAGGLVGQRGLQQLCSCTKHGVPKMHGVPSMHAWYSPWGHTG